MFPLNLLGKLRQRVDKKIIWLVLLGLSAVVGELGLRALETQQRLWADLKKVQGRIEVLVSSSDEIDWTRKIAQLEAAKADLQSRLWQAPSEAQGQAMLRDWLNESLKGAEFKKITIGLLPVQSSLESRAQSRTQDAPKDADESSGMEHTLASQALRVRATVGLELAPGVLEAALQRIEQGKELASVDVLSVSRRSRRIELVVSVPVIVNKASQAVSRNSGE